MDSLAQILEEELENAVEVKDKKSLHRYVVLLSHNVVSRESCQNHSKDLKNDVGEIVDSMKSLQKEMNTRFETVQKEMNTRFETVQSEMNARFESVQSEMNIRFESMQQEMNLRFEHTQKHMDDRFTDNQNFMDRRFKMQFAFMTFSVTLLAVLMSIYNFI